MLIEALDRRMHGDFNLNYILLSTVSTSTGSNDFNESECAYCLLSSACLLYHPGFDC